MATLKFNPTAAMVVKAARTRETATKPLTGYEEGLYAYLASNPSPVQVEAGHGAGVQVIVEDVTVESLNGDPVEAQKAVDRALAKLRRKIPALTIRGPLLTEVTSVKGLLAFPVETASKITRERHQHTDATAE